MAAAAEIAFLDRPDAAPKTMEDMVRAIAADADNGRALRVRVVPTLTPDAIAAIVHGDRLDDAALLAALERASVPVVMFAGAKPHDAAGLPVFRLCGDAAGEAEHSVRHLRMKGVRAWALLIADGKSGRALGDAAARSVAEFGGAVMVRHEFRHDEPRFESGLANAARAGVQAVFLAATPGAQRDSAALAAQALRAMRRCRLPGLLHLPGAFVSDETLVALGRDGEGTIAASAGSAARHAEAALRLMVDLIEAAGPDPRRLTSALTGLRGHPGPLGAITFDERGGNPGVHYDIHVIDDGRWLRWEASDYALGLKRLPGVLA